MSEHGWKPMPTSMKVLFIILLVSIFSTLVSVINIDLLLSIGTFFLGFYVKDALALTLYTALSLLAVVIFAIALWKRYKWTAKYGLVYFIYSTLNIVMMIVNIDKFAEIINSSTPTTSVSPQAAAMAMQMIQVMMVFSLSLGIAFGILFLIFIWRARKYFEQA